MDEIIVQALSTITGVLESFLPTPTPGVAQNLTVIPKSIKPTGLGGYIGVNNQPVASLYGRYIHAISEVSLISSSGLGSLSLATDNISRNLLSQDRTTLRNNSIFKITYDQMSGISHTGTGANTTDSRSIRFVLEFEFIPQPQQPEDLISEIEHSLELALASGRASFFGLNFADVHAAGDNPLAHFTFLDDPGINATSPSGNWNFNEAMGSINQSSDVRGGGTTLNAARKAGTQALVLAGQAPLTTRNMILKADIISGDQDGIGFVFRWMDENNFYYYIISNRHNYHLIGKKVSGNYRFLDNGGINQTVGFSANQVIHAKLLIEDHRFMVYMNEKYIMSGADGSLLDGGRLGFLSHRNADANFLNIKLIHFS